MESHKNSLKRKVKEYKDTIENKKLEILSCLEPF